ncbi:MAG TPA: dihydrodipicolinate reductase [Myxococcaceae bacterium]|jgi:4-hydroxy-tetrahydrodipicolinate reductase|nr:dihydrodipicolinate reductase [Myxococcaceae bacterium]
MARVANSGTVPVVVMGLGAIGREIARASLQSEEVTLVGAVDTHTSIVGKRLDELGIPSPLQVEPALRRGPTRGRRPVVLHATGSSLPAVAEQLLAAVKEGHPVVSTCEELSFPWVRHPELSERLERAAQRSGVSVLGTGVNPGFVLDRLAATLGQTLGPVRHVLARRVVDARTRREALQRKIGAGLTEDEFDALAAENRVGHVGLLESAALCALGLGMDLDEYEEEVAPVLAHEDIPGGAFLVPRGRVAGVNQTVVGLVDGQERVRLELMLALGAEPPGDQIVIESDTPLRVEIPGGIPGDSATAQLVVHAAPRVAAAESGLLTVLDLPAGR